MVGVYQPLIAVNLHKHLCGWDLKGSCSSIICPSLADWLAGVVLVVFEEP